MEKLLEVATGVVNILAIVLAGIAIIKRQRRPTADSGCQRGGCFPSFSLAMLLYLVTVAAIFFRVEMVTAGTSLNDPAGGFVIWSAICGGIALHLWLRKRAAAQNQTKPPIDQP